MPLSLLNIGWELPVFALVLFRITGLMLTAPLFASSMIPLRVRVALSMAVSLVLFPLVRHQVPAELTLGLALAAGVAEVMIGVTIGLGLALLVAGVESAGLILGHQAALGLGEVINPTLEEQSSVPAQIYGLSFLILFLIAGGHRAGLAAVMDTFQAVPLLTILNTESLMLLLAAAMTASLSLGLRLAGPMVLALFLTETTLAILSRAVPQLNILTVGFSLRLMIAHAVTAVALTSTTPVLLDGIWDTMDRLREGFGLNPSDVGLVS